MEATLPTVTTQPNISPRAQKISLTAWWGAFGGVLLLGFFLAIVGYNHALPFIDYGDEMTIWSFGRAYIDPSWVNTGPEYPPGIVVVSALVQKVQIALGDPFVNVAATVQIMRLMSVGWFLVALAVIMLLARRLAGPIAGIFAGLFWATLPNAVYLAKLSTNNLWLSAWFIISVSSGIEGWHRRSLRWIAFSFIAGLIATLIKYQAGAVVLIAPMACLALWKTNRQKMLRSLTIMFVILAVFGYWAIFIFHALSGEIYVVGQKNSFPTLANTWINLQTQVTVVGPFLIFGLLPLVALALSAILPSARRLHTQFGLWMSIPVILGFEVILSSAGAPLFERQYLSAMTLLAVLAGVGVALAIDLIQRVFSSPGLFIVRAFLIGFVLIAAGYISLQMANESRVIAVTSTYPDRRAIFADWARSTATEGPRFINLPDHFLS